jgi:hypothetical protein
VRRRYDLPLHTGYHSTRRKKRQKSVNRVERRQQGGNDVRSLLPTPCSLLLTCLPLLKGDGSVAGVAKVVESVADSALLCLLHKLAKIGLVAIAMPDGA